MNMFKAWSKEEENNLLIEFKELSIDDIAIKHNRTKRAIELRLQDIAVIMEKDGISDDIILQTTGVSKKNLLIRKKSKEKKTDKSDTLSENKEIRLELKEIKLELKAFNLKLKELKLLIEELCIKNN